VITKAGPTAQNWNIAKITLIGVACAVLGASTHYRQSHLSAESSAGTVRRQTGRLGIRPLLDLMLKRVGGRHDQKHLTNCANDSDVCGGWRLPVSLFHGSPYRGGSVHASWCRDHGSLRTSTLLPDRGRLCADPTPWSGLVSRGLLLEGRTRKQSVVPTEVADSRRGCQCGGF
jgi:hypothetical protein